MAENNEIRNSRGKFNISIGSVAVVSWPGNPLHGKRVTVERFDPAMDIAHPDCAERMIVAMAFVLHPTLPRPIGISPERLESCAGVPPQLSAQSDRDRGSADRNQLELVL